MYKNKNGEFVETKTYTNESGETVKQYKTYQHNGWIRINEYYPDGTTTETFEKE